MLLLLLAFGSAFGQLDDDFLVPETPQSRQLTLPVYHSYDGVTWETRGELTLTIQEERRRKSQGSLRTSSFEKARLSPSGLYYVAVGNEDQTRIQTCLPVCYLLGSDLLEKLTVHVDAETGRVVSIAYTDVSPICSFLTSSLRPQTYIEIGSSVQALKPLFTVPKPTKNPEDEPSFFSKYVTNHTVVGHPARRVSVNEQRKCACGRQWTSSTEQLDTSYTRLDQPLFVVPA